MAVRTTNSNNYPSVSWADTLDMQRSALRWDVKRAMKSLCSKLEEIGEECFVVTVNVSNGWVGHLGTIRGDEYIDEKSHILYDFLNFCAESLRDDECDDVTPNNTSDTEPYGDCVGENKKSDTEQDDKPIQISRPPPSNEETDGLEQEDHVIVETPVRYLSRKPKMSLIPPDLQLDKFILLNPVALPIVTPNVVKATNIPKEHLSVDKQTDQATEGKRKRKQSFEGKVGYSKDRHSSSPTNEKEHSETLKIDYTQGSQKCKHKSGDTDTQQVFKDLKKKDGNHGNQVDAEDTESVGSENTSDVSESDRVLRSTSLQGKKAEWKTLLQKPKESDKNDEVDEENVWNVEYDADDINDEDWTEDIEGRDRLGRFLPCDNSSKRKKNKKKRRKTDEFLVSSDNTFEGIHKETPNVTSCADSSKTEKETWLKDSPEKNQNVETANTEDSVEGLDDGIEGIDENTGHDNQEEKSPSTSKSRKKKGKVHVSLQEKRSKTESSTEGIDLQEADTVAVNYVENRDQLVENLEKSGGKDRKPFKRPSLKRKLKNIADENWTVINDKTTN